MEIDSKITGNDIIYWIIIKDTSHVITKHGNKTSTKRLLVFKYYDYLYFMKCFVTCTYGLAQKHYLVHRAFENLYLKEIRSCTIRSCL